MQLASTSAIGLIKLSESLELKAYMHNNDGKWTIGYGTTVYPDGFPVKPGDKITEKQADEYLLHHIDLVSNQVTKALGTTKINQNQFDALVSFVYNLGIENLLDSTLLKKIKANPTDKSIADEFAKWIHCKGKVLPGLVTRRKKESDLYFKSL